MIDGCLKNNRQAQKELYETYAPAMLGLCERYTRSRDEAEDCMIEGFVNVFKHLEQFQHKSSLETWIRSIMIRSVLDNFRIRKRRIQTETIDETQEVPDNSTSTDEQIITKLHAKTIIERMQEMPEVQRIIFNLHTIDDLTFKDIAEQLEMNANTVRAYYQRARKWLQKEIGNMVN